MNAVGVAPYFFTRLDMMAQGLLSPDELGQLVSQDGERLIAHVRGAAADQQDSVAFTDLIPLIAHRMYQDFQILLRPFNGNNRLFLRHAVRWFELMNLKVLIRGKFTGVSETGLRGQLVDLGEFAELPLDKLMDTDDPLEMLRRLEDTVYGDIVRQARHVFEEQGHDLFSLDSAIDRNFFIGLASRTRFLAETEQRHLRQVLGVLMDRFNLLWLLRYRFSYGLSAARAYYLLTATGPLLDSARLMQLARLGSLAEVIEALPRPLKQLLAAAHDIYHVEQLMELYSFSAARKGLEHGQPAVTRLFSYLILREAETRYLQAIITGKQLGFSEPLIQQAIGGKH